MKAGSARWNVLLLAVALARAAWAAGTAEAEPPLAVPALAGNEAEPQRDLRWRNAALASGTALAVAYYGRRNWWQDGFAGEFRSRSEGWFGRNTENGGADKLGHAMFTYAGVRLGTRAYEGLGNSPQAARRLGFWTALGTMTAVEIADGYTKKWRFSREDLVMDLAGAGLGWLLETRPELDALIDLRLHYRRSRVAGVQQKFDPFGDYSGQTYVLAFKAAGVPALRRHAVARYLELVVGYRAHGFEAEAAVAGARSRHVYVGLALNLSELLRASVFAGSSAPSRTQRVSETVLEFVQVPGTAAAARHEF